MNRLRIRLLATFMAIAVGLLTGPALADTINFLGGPGGSVTYDGGTSPLVGANLPIDLAYGTQSGQSTWITGGLLSFTTGNYSGYEHLWYAFQYLYESGGDLTITGQAFGLLPESTLLTATFSTSPVFSYYGLGVATMMGGLAVSYLNEQLALGLGLVPFDQGSGSIYQLDLLVDFNGYSQWGFGTPGPAESFLGTQGGVKVIASGTSLVLANPSTLILLGFGLLALSWVGRKR